MSFLKKLFGLGGASAPGAAASGPTEAYGEYAITATPYESNGRWQLCGIISREVEGVIKEHRFVRADTFAARDEAEQMTLFKARQIIDQLGDEVFGGA